MVHGGQLYALWEGGSATRLDPRTLETRGLKTWRADLAGVPFSAHPRVEPDGTIWNFGVDAHHGLLLLYEIAPAGALRRAEAFPLSHMPMVHDFAVTAGHLVFLLPPLVYDAQRRLAGASVLDAHQWRPELGMRVLVVNKQDWKRQQMFHLPAGFLFHLGNAWEEQTASGTVIHLDYARATDASGVLTDTREVNAIDFNGQALRLTRRDMAASLVDNPGLRVVAWTRQATSGQWARWQSPPLRRRDELAQAWARASQWGLGEQQRDGAGTNDTAHSVHMTKEATKLGVAGILAVTPYYNRPPQSGIEGHMRAMAASTISLRCCMRSWWRLAFSSLWLWSSVMAILFDLLISGGYRLRSTHPTVHISESCNYFCAGINTSVPPM